VLKSDVTTECGRRLGDTSAGFLGILSHAFDFVLLELAQLECIGALRRTSQFVFNTGTVSNGLRAFSTRTITALPAPLYPSSLHRLLVPGWGVQGLLSRKNDADFEQLWIGSGTTYTGRPQIWRTYPSEQQLQVWPQGDDDSASATCLVEYTAPPDTLVDTDPIEEIGLVDIPTILAGLYRHGIKFQDETISSMAQAENMWNVGVGAMKTRRTNAEFHGRYVQIRYRDV
jgi:hypothetical protein